MGDIGQSDPEDHSSTARVTDTPTRVPATPTSILVPRQTLSVRVTVSSISPSTNTFVVHVSCSGTYAAQSCRASSGRARRRASARCRWERRTGQQREQTTLSLAQCARVEVRRCPTGVVHVMRRHGC
jgi:hypothetical protein